MMTDAEKGLFDEMAQLALRIVRGDLERGEGVTPVIVLRQPGGTLKQLPFPQEFAVLMNDGQSKDAIFGAVRLMVQATGATMVLFATDGYIGVPTEAGMKVDPEEILRATRERGFQTAVDRGWVRRMEAILVTVQSAEWVYMLSHPYERVEGGILFGEPDTKSGPQAGFSGRQKMYGDVREENLK